MIENKSDKNGNKTRNKKLIRGKEQKAWDNLTFRYGLTNSNLSDDFELQNSLSYTWSNKIENELLFTRLDRAYIGEWTRDRRGKINILEGFGTLSDHLPVLLTIRKQYVQHLEQDNTFKFNLSFSEDPSIKKRIENTWNELPRPNNSEPGWMLWVAEARSNRKSEEFL